MKVNKPSLFFFAGSLCCAVSWLQADTVVTADGSQLMGEIVSVSGGKLTLETKFAGKLEIDLSQVSSFSSEDAETVRLNDGNVLVGPVVATPGGNLSINTSGGAVTTSTADVAAVWAPGERDPDVVAREKALDDQIRRWSYEAAVSITGKAGNTEKSSYAASAAAKLEGPHDRLDIYASLQYAEETVDDVTRKSADEAIFGMGYTNFFSEHFGWYVREELEYDYFENIEFRSTTGGGLTYRFFKKPNHSLEGRAGLSYRYEGFRLPVTRDGEKLESEGYFGLDFGLSHYWKFADWGEMKNTLRYTPSVEDFNDYLVDHVSSVDIPLGTSDFWKLRLSLSNQYNSSVVDPREKLDTTYGLSLLLNWR
jgi:putative salt-induced outer membrane protein YdiY